MSKNNFNNLKLPRVHESVPHYGYLTGVSIMAREEEEWFHWLCVIFRVVSVCVSIYIYRHRHMHTHSESTSEITGIAQNHSYGNWVSLIL